MKKFLKFIGIVILLAIAFVLVAGLFIEKKYHFERSITINASKEEIWKNISVFSNFEKWDPWTVHDPKMKRMVTGTDGTSGATYSWNGNKEVGTGSQTYLELVPYDHVNIALQFKEPMKMKALVKYTMKTAGNGYKITWSFDSELHYPLNAIANLFINMDKNLDKDFSTGLSNLKKLCESNATYTTFLYNEKAGIAFD